MTDEFLQKLVASTGKDLSTAIEFLISIGYTNEWFENATVGDVLNEYDKLKQ